MKKVFQRSVAFVLSGALFFSVAQTTGLPVKARETLAEAVEEKGVTQFMDCMDPMPIVGELSEDCWGAGEVGARDQDNGLEDRTLENYCYWDGGILKDEKTGKYYMFASRWNQAGGHWGENTDSGWVDGWQGSQAVYAVSDNLYGPYKDMGPIWPDWCEGAGHNVFPFELSESDPLCEEGYRYAISISDTGKHGEIANGTIHISKSLEGPWELVENGNSGKLKAEGGSGFSHSNISIMVRPDGRYEATNRNGDIALADSVAGTWEVVENGLWEQIENMSSVNVEDPVIWYSDGLYHIVANKWDARMAYYLTSEDGITNWKRHQGTAYIPGADFMRYEDGTVNRWTKLERPNIYVEDGEIKAITFAVIDVQKEEDHGDDQHGSKIVVVPFSSEKLRQLNAKPDPLENRAGVLPVADTTAQTWGEEENKNYGAERHLQLQKSLDYESSGNGLLGEGRKPYDEYDNKIGYMKYDLSKYDLLETDQIESASLSLVYKGKASGDGETTMIEAVLADSEWEEGTGRESFNGNWAKGLTWKTQPALSYDENQPETIARSEEFHTADLQRVVEIDVTSLVKQFLTENPQEEFISFAVNVSAAGSRFQFYSKESGKKLAPRLMIQVGKPEEPDQDTALEEAIEKAEQAQKEAEMLKAEAEAAKKAAKEETEAAKKKAEEAVREAEKRAAQAALEAKKAKEELAKLNTQAEEKQTARPEKASLKSVKAKKKGQIQISWKKQKNVTGYEVQYARSPKFKNAAVRKAGAGKAGIKIVKLKSRGTYYIRIRAFRKEAGKTIYGAYSKKRKVIIK